MCHVLGIDRGRLLIADDMSDAAVVRYRDLVAERARRILLQHLTGTAAFGPLDLSVGPGCSCRDRRPNGCSSGRSRGSRRSPSRSSSTCAVAAARSRSASPPRSGGPVYAVEKSSDAGVAVLQYF